MIRKHNMIDRLYLSQGNEDCIYIDHCKVPQHSIEGIRFLHRQFLKRKCGVILNDPLRFDRNTQVCLFLKAIRKFIHRPILILCQDGSERDWYDRLDTWTEGLIEDTAIETVNPYIQKKIIINPMVNLHSFCQREWSVIAVDGDQVTNPNPILKLPFKASFKIWNTEISMKDNLDRFEEVYKWIYPREIFDKQFYIPDYGSAQDIITKAVLLDTFFEEIVLRRVGVTPSFENYKRESRESLTETTLTIIGPKPSSSTTLGKTTTRPTIAAPKETPMFVGDTIITRTTVDPTIGGVRIVGDTTITPKTIAPSTAGSTTASPSTAAFGTVTPSSAGCRTLSPSTAGYRTVSPTTAGSRTIGQTTIIPTADTIMTVCDTSITSTNVNPATSPVPAVTITRKNKDATGTKIKRSKPKIPPENVPKLFNAPIAVLAKLIEESPKPDPAENGTFSRNSDYCIENYKKSNGKDNGPEQSNVETSKDVRKTDKVIEIIDLPDQPEVAQTSGAKLVEMDTLVFGIDTLISPVLDTDVSGKRNHTASDKKEIEPHTILTCKPVGERSTHNKLFKDNNKSTSTITSKTSTRCSDTERDEKNDRKIIKGKSPVPTDKPEVDIIKINLDELNREMRELGTRDTPERLVKRQKTTDSGETATCYDEIRNKFREQNRETSISVTKINTEQIVNSLKRNNIDVKMKECEETVSKKFKGSLLDRLF